MENSLHKCWACVLSLVKNTHTNVGLKVLMEVHAVLKKHGKMKVYITWFKKLLVQERNARVHSLETGMCNFVCMKLLRALRQINVFMGFYFKESLVLI